MVRRRAACGDQQCGVAGLAPRHGAGTATPNRIARRRVCAVRMDLGSCTAVVVDRADFSASKVSSIIGLKVALEGAKVEVTTSECIYIGTFEVIISRAPGIPAADLATVAKAEARIKSQSPKGVKFTFTSLPALGPTAFSWSYKLNGGQLVGVADNEGTTGFGTMLGGIPKLVGVLKKGGVRSALKSLIKLDMAA